jgi:hypothetical protein
MMSEMLISILFIGVSVFVIIIFAMAKTIKDVQNDDKKD